MKKKMKNQQNIPRFSFLLFLKKKGEEKILNFNFICMDCFKKQFIQIKLKNKIRFIYINHFFAFFIFFKKKDKK